MRWLLVLGGILILLLLLGGLYLGSPSLLLHARAGTPSTSTAVDPTLVDYTRTKENFIPRPYEGVQGKDVQYYPLPPTFLNFQLKGDAIDVANMYGTFFQTDTHMETVPTSSFLYKKSEPYQVWTLPATRFKKAFSQSGIYAVLPMDPAQMTEKAITDMCERDPYCLCVGIVHTPPTTQYWKSTLHPMTFIQQCHANIYSATSPLERSTVVGDTVMFILRRPVLLTALKESQCTCTTLCAVDEATGTTSLYSNVGSGTALGTLDMEGLYYPSGELVLPAASLRTNLIANNDYSLTYERSTMQALLLDKHLNIDPTTLPHPTDYVTNLHTHYRDAEAQSRAKVCVCIHDPLAVGYKWPPTLVPSLQQSYLACPIQLPSLLTNSLAPPPIIGPPNNGYTSS